MLPSQINEACRREMAGPPSEQWTDLNETTDWTTKPPIWLRISIISYVCGLVISAIVAVVALVIK